jgi:SAM-dependent methyltransferase
MRFAFGKNWQSYSQIALTPQRIEEARDAFRHLVDGIDLRDKRFIDIGFGQGLSLIAAMEMGAEVLGIDIDDDNIEALKTTAQAMGCTQPPEVRVVSILDRSFVENNRGKFDVVHSWGVLHHTRDMRHAIENACALVAHNGCFICSIYNRHWSSPLWKIIKWSYNKLPAVLQRLVVGILYPVIYAAKRVVTGKNPKKKERGMDFFHDVVDWVGGYPYEYASEGEIRSLVCGFGFACLRVSPAQVPTGCNEFVFQKEDKQAQPAAPPGKK